MFTDDDMNDDEYEATQLDYVSQWHDAHQVQYEDSGIRRSISSDEGDTIMYTGDSGGEDSNENDSAIANNGYSHQFSGGLGLFQAVQSSANAPATSARYSHQGGHASRMCEITETPAKSRPKHHEFGRTSSFEQAKVSIAAPTPISYYPSISVPQPQTLFGNQQQQQQGMKTPRGHHGNFVSPNDITFVPQTPGTTDQFKRYDSISHGHGYNHHHGMNGSNSPSSTSRMETDFEILEEIGNGVFGSVYKARGKIDGVQYAVKRSLRRFRSDSDREKMVHEVHALAALSANEDSEMTATIVRYYGAWFEDDHLVICMELCETNIEGLMKSKLSAPSPCLPFSFDEVFSIMRDILQALKVLHRNDFVHLDIKPANILRKNHRYKLGDFGLALHIKRGNGSQQGGSADPNSVEEGDSRYMAKELLDWEPVRDLTKCDIFSLGATCYEIACFPSRTLKSDGQEWQDVRMGRLPMPPGAPQEFVDMIPQMMCENPAMRPSADTLCGTYVSLKTEIEKELIRQKICNDGLKAMLERSTVLDSSKPRLPLKRHNTVA